MKTNESFVELLIWIIAYELNDLDTAKNHKNLLKQLYDGVSDSCKLPKKSWDKELLDKIYSSNIELGYKIRNFYLSHFTDSIEGNDFTLKQIQRLQNGRYEGEFEQLNYIAGGKYGKVFKAKNRHDLHEYAIKKVKYAGI